MNQKKTARLRRAKSTRFRIKSGGRNRLCVNKTGQHMYAQIISPDGGTILATASTLEKSFKESATSNVSAADEVGRVIAERALEKGVTEVSFDRSGFQYHGRIKALANAARNAGLQF